jgi:hypothetical protein
LEPDGAAPINCGEHDTADLNGDVVLGTFSARSKQDAFRLARHCIPDAAKEDFDLDNNPEGFGLKAYLLEEREEGD